MLIEFIKTYMKEYIQKIRSDRILTQSREKKLFQNILDVANDILCKNYDYMDTHPIYLLIKELVDLELYKNIYANISTDTPDLVKEFSFHDLLPCNSHEDKLYGNLKYYDFIDQSEIKNKSIGIKLGYDPILTHPWNTDRLARALSSIGVNKPWGAWKQDDHNHRAYLVLPFGVTFVEGGNHSITAGILNNDGILVPKNIFDFSRIFSHIRCDGINYIKIIDGRLEDIYTPVTNFSLSAVFEIGRLIYEKKKIGKDILFKGIN